MTSRCARRPAAPGAADVAVAAWLVAWVDGVPLVHAVTRSRARRRTIQLPIGHARPPLCAARPVQVTISIRAR
jgi:hypothetical protein